LPCVTDTETGKHNFTKADDGRRGPPDYNKPFKVSDPATWPEHTDNNTRCAIARRGPIHIKSDAHFFFHAREKFAGTRFKHDSYFRKLNSGET
jgi:hypothetical protein